MMQIGERCCRRNRQYPCYGGVADVVGIEMKLENVIHALTGRLVRGSFLCLASLGTVHYFLAARAIL